MPVSGFYAELFVAFALTGSLTGLVLGKWYTLAQGVKCKIPIDSTELTPLNEAIRFFQNRTHGVQDGARPQLAGLRNLGKYRLYGFLGERKIGFIANKAGWSKVMQHVLDERQCFFGSHWRENKNLRPPNAVPQFSAKPRRHAFLRIPRKR